MRARAALLVAVLLLAGCGRATGSRVHEQLFLPSRAGPAPIVVLVPGGGWKTADPTGMVPLARALARDGYVVGTTTYRAADAGAHFPTPVEDVLCAAARTARKAAAAGHGGGPVVLVGHSAGGQLAVLAALHPGAFRAGCRERPVTPAAVVGLAGAYDVRGLGPLGENLFGTGSTAAAWTSGNVFRWVRERPDLPVLLLHGSADDLVPADTSRRLAAALQAASHPVQLQVLPGATHRDLYAAPVSGRIDRWLQFRARLPSTAAR